MFRGRLRQALNGNWVFNASTGQNGVVGFDLGPPGGAATSTGANWSSSETPTTGVQVFISYQTSSSGGAGVSGGAAVSPAENISLTTVLPSDFSD